MNTFADFVPSQKMNASVDTTTARATDIPCLKFDKYADVHQSGYGVGAFSWGERAGGKVLHIWLPDGITSLPVSFREHITHTEDGDPVWCWDGNESSPTLSQSIDNSGRGGWHGFLRKGRIITP